MPWARTGAPGGTRLPVSFHAASEDACTARTARSTSSSTATCTLGRPRVEPAERPRQAVHRLLLRLPPEPQPRSRWCGTTTVLLLRRRPADEGPVRRRLRRPRHLPAGATSSDFYIKGFGQTEEACALTQAHPDKLTYNHAFDPRNGEAGLDELRGDAERFGPQGRQALHGRVDGDSRATSSTTRGRAVPRGVPASSGSRTSTSTRARRSARSTGTRSTSPTSTRWRPTSRASTSSSSTSACRAWRTSAGSPPRSPTSTAAWRWRCPFIHTRPALLRPDHRRVALLGRRGQDPVRQ